MWILYTETRARALSAESLIISQSSCFSKTVQRHCTLAAGTIILAEVYRYTKQVNLVFGDTTGADRKRTSFRRKNWQNLSCTLLYCYDYVGCLR